jgi:endonuclease YncB( thermonuclease family)
MRSRFLAIFAVITLISGLNASFAATFKVSVIHDGDTLKLSTGENVRFLQIDTPELSPPECYGEEARQALVQLLGKSNILLESDSVSDDVDQYDRLLRYVKVGKVNVNLKLVQIGAATPYFHQGQRGKYSSQLFKAAQTAKAKKIGLWKLCPNTKLDPNKLADTGPVPNKSSKSTEPLGKCDPNYQGCIPPYPPDLDCGDIKKMGLAPIKVIGRDEHNFDGDGDGIGCDK